MFRADIQLRADHERSQSSTAVPSGESLADYVRRIAGQLTDRIIALGYICLGYWDLVGGQAQIDRVRECVPHHSTAFLFTHKSYVDGMAQIRLG